MSVEVGSKVQGKVTGITNFGAFVELPGGTTGLVHISEVADSYVKDVNDHLKIGDVVEVKVISEKTEKLPYPLKKQSISLKDKLLLIHNAHSVKVEAIAVQRISVQRETSNLRKALKIKWPSS